MNFSLVLNIDLVQSDKLPVSNPRSQVHNNSIASKSYYLSSPHRKSRIWLFIIWYHFLYLLYLFQLEFCLLYKPWCKTLSRVINDRQVQKTDNHTHTPTTFFPTAHHLFAHSSNNTDDTPSNRSSVTANNYELARFHRMQNLHNSRNAENENLDETNGSYYEMFM